MAKNDDSEGRAPGKKSGDAPHPIQETVDLLAQCLHRGEVYKIDRSGHFYRPPWADNYRRGK